MGTKNVSIKLGPILNIAEVGINRASSFMALGLKVADDDSIRSAKLGPASTYLFMPDPLTPELAEKVRYEFRHWIIGNALREIEQHFVTFLDKLFRILTILEWHGKRLPAKAFDSVRRFASDTNLAKKLRQLCDDFELKVSWRDHLVGLAPVRNVIAHNHAVVRARDCPDGKTLRISWIGADLKIDELQIPLAPEWKPIRLKSGQQIRGVYSVRERQFRVGERIEFSSLDLQEICVTYIIGASQIIEATKVHARDLGVPLHDSSQSSGGVQG